MSSIIPGFEYDIFISYRQKDNKGDRWVSEFVNALKSELDATFKETISIYFDENPHDGLHENYNVDDSLREKLKCLIFIPIVSRTYCDPRAFAWVHEFKAFNAQASGDIVGLKVRLLNSNTASRILPVRVHELEPEDIKLFETESNSVLRPIDFVFKSAGVNRPLLPSDKKDENANHTIYRDQINKLANAIREIISAIQRNSRDSQETGGVGSLRPQERVSMPGKKKTRILVPVAIVLAIAATSFVVNSLIQKSKNNDSGKSIAVLPFTILSENANQEYFGDGITEEISTQLSKVSDLKVIARSSVIRYKNTSKDITDIGKELGVRSILEGTVRLAGKRVRITANLSDAETRQQLWAETYNREIQDIFSVQSEVAKEIVGALKANFSSSEKEAIEKIPTANIEAYNLYLKAKYNYAKTGKEGLRMAFQLTQQAITLDENFSLAYTLLANCYALISYYNFNDIEQPAEARAKAKEAALKAISLDPNSAEAHDALGYILRTCDWNWSESELEFRTAIKLNPNLTNAHRRMALLMAVRGRFAEAIKEAQYALQLDPLGSLYNSDLARLYYYAGDFDKSIALAKKSFDLEPDYRPALGLIGCILEQKGLRDSSVVMISKSASRTGTDYEGIADRFESTPMPYQKYWDDVLKRSVNNGASGKLTNVVIAVLQVRAHNYDQAITSLEKALQNREGVLVYVNVDPVFKPLRDDVRFKKIIQSMNLN